MNRQDRPCSACFGQRTGIITETFRLDLDAFKRHAELVDSGHAPSLCIRRDGNRHVCHLPLPASAPIRLESKLPRPRANSASPC